MCDKEMTCMRDLYLQLSDNLQFTCATFSLLGGQKCSNVSTLARQNVSYIKNVFKKSVFSATLWTLVLWYASLMDQNCPQNLSPNKSTEISQDVAVFHTISINKALIGLYCHHRIHSS